MTIRFKTGLVTSRIINEIGSAIVLGKYAEGAALPPEAELGLAYKGSRSVLREAIKILSAKGLLTTSPGRGTIVEPSANWIVLDPDVLQWMLKRKISLELVGRFLEMRLAIEPEAAGLAAMRADDEAKAAIRAAINRMEAADRGDDDALASDIAFHLAVLTASGNQFFVQMSPLVETALQFSIRLTNRLKGVRMASVADHAKVATRIEAGDAEGARFDMRRLLEGAVKVLATAALARE
jgi:DNA-binding FadR family transcriptional regulator